MRSLVLIFAFIFAMSGCVNKGYLRNLDDFKPMIIKYLGEPSSIDSTQFDSHLTTFYIFKDNPKVSFEKVNAFLVNGTRSPSHTWHGYPHRRGGLWPLVDEYEKNGNPDNFLYLIQFGEFHKANGHIEIYICTLDYCKKDENATILNRALDFYKY